LKPALGAEEPSHQFKMHRVVSQLLDIIKEISFSLKPLPSQPNFTELSM
jgi:hypothetical protein